MSLVRVYAWSCVIALPPTLGLGILYLFFEGRIGVAATFAATFALACICVTAVALSIQGDDGDATIERDDRIRPRS